MGSMFFNCESLSSLPDISNWNTSNVNDMSYMFANCKSLSVLPDISKWNTINFQDIRYISSNCKSLLYLPDISKWNFNNILDMSSIISGCDSLSYFPDISKWKINDETNLNWMFKNCPSLLLSPDINSMLNPSFIESKNINDMPKSENKNKNVQKYDDNLINFDEFSKKNMIRGILDIKLGNDKYIFFNPDFANIINVFINNKKIKMIKDECHWTIDYNFQKIDQHSFILVFNDKVTNLKGLMEDCVSIISLDVSNLDTSNVIDMEDIFKGCNNLKEIK